MMTKLIIGMTLLTTMIVATLGCKSLSVSTDGASNLSSFNIGNFNPGTSGPSWNQVVVNMQRLDGNKAAVNQTFNSTAFQTGNAQNVSLKIPQGTYTINLTYTNTSGTTLYSECTSVHTKSYLINTAKFTTQIPVCAIGSTTPTGNVPVIPTNPTSPTSDVTITPQLNTNPSTDGQQGGTTATGIGPNGYPYCTNGSNTGSGYGWDTSVTDPKGSHSCLVPTSAGSTNSNPTNTATGGNSGSLAPLNVNAAGNSKYQIHDYGSALRSNKQNVLNAAMAAGANAQEQALIIAMAMQETTLMDPSQRVTNKDGTSSANCSVLNLNYYMLSQLGYAVNDNGASLNNPANLGQAIGYLLKGFRTWGIERTLNFQRGGSTAFQDGTSYGAADYRNAITTIYNLIVSDLTLESDGRRVEINLYGV